MSEALFKVKEGTKRVINVRDMITEVIIPDGVTEIIDEAFLECIALTKVVIPDSVTKIGGWTFAWCKSLTSVTIGENVTVIESCAFEGCKNLTEIKIPSKVSLICVGAFDGCESLKAIYIDQEKGSPLDFYLKCAGIPEDCNVYWRGEFNEVKK